MNKSINKNKHTHTKKCATNILICYFYQKHINIIGMISWNKLFPKASLLILKTVVQKSSIKKML